MSILATLGWRSIPVVNVGNDQAGLSVIEELTALGVDVSQIGIQRHVETPVVYQRPLGTSGHHSFSFTCPSCGRARRFTEQLLPKVGFSAGSSLVGRGDVFFFDRLTASSVQLAEDARANGALTVFEPSTAGDARLFERALRASQIVKYSSERMSSLVTRSLPAGFIEVQTLGADGLRFRMRSLDPAWVTLPAIRAGRIVDTAGAGDWCTSAFLHLMSRYAPSGSLSDLGYNHVYCALRTGQVVAALNCAHAGARGLMRTLHSQRLRALLVSVSERLASESGQAPSHPELEQLLGEELEAAQTAGDPVAPRMTTLCCGPLSELGGSRTPTAPPRIH
jgi:fructokinase